METISIWWVVNLVILPVVWIMVQRLMKARDETIQEMKQKSEKQETEQKQRMDKIEVELKNSHDRVIRLEASSVTKSELIEILRDLEEAIEQRFDKSFEKLEKSFERLIERKDK